MGNNICKTKCGYYRKDVDRCSLGKARPEDEKARIQMKLLFGSSYICTKEFPDDEIEQLTIEAFDGVIVCKTCGGHMEPDAERCPDCDRENPLMAMGLI